MGCSPACKQGTVFSVGTLLLLGGVLAGLFWSDVADYIYRSQLSLSPSSTGFRMWRETPIPMYLQIYFFNWTNPDEVKAGKAKPIVYEVGPYTYLEKHTRVNMTWHPENDTISFQQIREWHFDPSKSSGSPDDVIQSLNVLAATIAEKVKNFRPIVKKVVNVLLNVEEPFAVKKTVRELLFDGYSDPILNVASELKKITNISIPFDKFGWFYDRNMSSTYDGSFNMFTGQQNMSNLGNVHSWNYATHTSYFDGKCGDVKGTTGELLPPLVDSEKLSVFATDLCSTVSLSRSEELVQKYGIEGVKFQGDAREFDNGTLHPEYKCYSYEGKTMPSGVRDMSKCRYGAPAYVSFPHFLDADPWYTNSVDGLHPNRSIHEFFVNAEPSTGLPLEVRAQLQINVLLQPIKGLTMYEKVPKVLMPMFYFRQTAELTPDLGSQVKLLLNLSRIGTITFYGLAGIGGLLLAIATFITIRGHWGEDDDTVALINSKRESSNKPASSNPTV
ncbi:protein croquemort isoform X2 [Frankliniella occidentalis]|nr:protein croquemort isoform X2 [Frankliniella occidentalis]XP_052131194.1 protein croquemort isoform X2 [Frankliniella occidentalis]